MELQAGSLHELFNQLVERHFESSLAIRDSSVTDYVATLLTDFAHTRNLYKIRDTQGRELQEVGEMLIESNPHLDAPSFDYEREVRKHIGDFTLFFTGMFPEAIGRWKARHTRLDAFIDYVKAGKESYHIVAEFSQFEYRKAAPLFRRLSDNFEKCVYGLNLVRQELDIGRPEVSRDMRRFLS